MENLGQHKKSETFPSGDLQYICAGERTEKLYYLLSNEDHKGLVAQEFFLRDINYESCSSRQVFFRLDIKSTSETIINKYDFELLLHSSCLFVPKT